MFSKFDQLSAEDYVHALFKFLLNRSDPEKEEFEYWVNFLLKNQDPTDLLTRFGLSDECQSRMATCTAFPAGHFYSPVVDIAEVERYADQLFSSRTLNDVDLNVNVQREIFGSLVQGLETIPFTDEKSNGLRYYYNNTSYAFGDAFGYWGILSRFRPCRIVEIGCGFTSALALDAIDQLNLDTACTFIDPYPNLLKQVAGPLSERHRLLSVQVQSVDPAVVDALASGDILFIDSSHVVKTASDVHFELTQLLPRLASGVIVHFHDVFEGFEYPKSWVVDARQSWNEVYFLQVFLMNNPKFEILYFNDFFAKVCGAELNVLPSLIRMRISLNPGGGLWLRRT